MFMELIPKISNYSYKVSNLFLLFGHTNNFYYEAFTGNAHDNGN